MSDHREVGVGSGAGRLGVDQREEALLEGGRRPDRFLK
jgi:hypothetical protein